MREPSVQTPQHARRLLAGAGIRVERGSLYAETLAAIPVWPASRNQVAEAALAALAYEASLVDEDLHDPAARDALALRYAQASLQGARLGALLGNRRASAPFAHLQTNLHRMLKALAQAYALADRRASRAHAKPLGGR